MICKSNVVIIHVSYQTYDTLSTVVLKLNPEGQLVPNTQMAMPAAPAPLTLDSLQALQVYWSLSLCFYFFVKLSKILSSIHLLY